MKPSVFIRNCLLTILSVFLLSASPLFAAARTMQIEAPADLAVTHGVGEIIFEEIDGALHMTVLNGRGAVVARAVVVKPDDQSRIGVITLRMGASWLELEWNPVHGYIAVTDLWTGQSGLLEPRPLAGEWQRDEAAEEILGAHYETAEFAAALFVCAEDEWYHTHMSPGGGGDMMGGSGTFLCISGRLYRGFALDSTRSYCCQMAALDVATQLYKRLVLRVLQVLSL